MNQTGIIIEGGAMRSVFAAGVLDFFMDNQIEVPNVLAVSAGAYAGMNYVSEQRGRTVESVVKPLEKEKYMGFSTFFRKGTFFDMDYLFDVVPKELSPFDLKTFTESAKRFLINITDCRTGKSVFYEKFESEEHFWKICRAANSLPFISKVTKIDGTPALDGGMADAIPIKKAKEEGWDKIIFILTRKVEYRKKYRYFYMMMIRLVYRKYPEFIQTVHERDRKYNACLEEINKMEKAGKALVIRPINMAITNNESNVKKLLEYYQQGYDEAAKREEEIRDFLLS